MSGIYDVSSGRPGDGPGDLQRLLSQWPAAATRRMGLGRQVLAAGLAGVMLCATGAVQAQTLPDILVNHDGLVAGVQDTSGPAGGTFTYRAKIKHNTGPDATGVTLTEVLPAGAIFQSLSPDPGSISCTPVLSSGTVLDATNNTFTCDVGDLGAADGFKWVDFNVILPTVGSTWTATATAALPDPIGVEDGDGGTNNKDLQRNFTTSLATDFGVKLTSDAPAAGVNNGDTYNYLIQVTNYGPSPLTSGGYAEVTFQVPSGAPVTGSGAIGGTDWTCSPANGPVAADGYIYCTYPESKMMTGSYGSGADLPPITVPVQSQMGGPIGAAVSVQGWNDVDTEAPDGQVDNNTDELIVQSTGDDYTDVSMTKSVSPQLVDAATGASTQVTYTLQVRRESGALEPEEIKINDTLVPTGVEFVDFVDLDSRWSCTGGGSIVCTWDGGAAYTGANGTKLPPIKFTANVAAQTAGNTITNTGHVTVKAGTEPNNANNSDSATVTFNNTAQLSLTKSAPDMPVKKGEPFQYTLTVKNEGPMPIAANAPITLTDTPSANLRLLSTDSGASSAGWTCSVPPSGTAGAAVTCENSSALPVGSTLKLVLNAQVDNLGGSDYVVIANNATAGEGSGRDGEVATSNANVTVSDQEADLEVKKEVISAPANPKSGDDITYRISVTNKAGSTQTAEAIKITDVLENLVRADDAPGYPGGGFVSAAQVTPLPDGTAEVNCPAPTGNANSRKRTLTCTVARLDVGKTVSVDVTIRPHITTASPNATTAMTYSNTARAFSPLIHDPTPDDNTASADIQMTSLVDLTVGKQVAPTPDVAAGEPATYTVTVINNGPSSAQNVKMVDILPANAILVGEPNVPSGGTCEHSAGPGNMHGQQGGTMTCTWTNPLKAHAQYVVQYKARSLGGDPAPDETMDNSVVVSTDTEEIDLSNNNADASIALKPANLDVQIQMSHSDDALVLGGTTEYTITVKNDTASTSYATDVVMTDLFPAAGSTATFSYQGGLALTGSGTSVPGYVSGVGTVAPSMCTEPAMGATTGPLACTIPLMAPGDTVIIKFTMAADSLPPGASTGTIFHAANVMPAETEFMPGYDALANNDTTDRTSTSATASAVDLGVNKQGPSGVPVAADTVIYTITVTNYGQDTMSPAGTMTDTLPAGLEFVSASTTTPGATCSGNVGTSDPVVCAVPAMAKGASIVYTVQAQVSDPFTGSYPLVNKADVSAPGDGNPDNDHDEVENGTAAASIPTLSEWGLILLALMLGLMAWRQQVARQRQRR